MVIVSLQGRDYQKDNSLVWQLLRPLIPETAAWNYVKQFDVTQDERSAFLALQTRGEGEAAVDARCAAAEDFIQTARYTGKSKRFSIGNYINLLQGAFTELESIKHSRNWNPSVKGSMPLPRNRRCQSLQRALLQRNMRQPSTPFTRMRRRGVTFRSVMHSWK
jgi:hypothetical protein